ncbi:hypothetical protein CON64_22695 [Bacillus pseudomycoides]|nr:hypothetical protein CON64_22695 [Bacillus pseudomycoides]
MFATREEYKEELNELLTQIHLSQEERNQAVEDITERYIESFGERPKKEDLNQLTNFILNDDLTSKQKKKKATEYSHLSERQLKTRRTTVIKTNDANGKEIVMVTGEFFYEGMRVDGKELDGDSQLGLLNQLNPNMVISSPEEPERLLIKKDTLTHKINNSEATEKQKEFIEPILLGYSVRQAGKMIGIGKSAADRRFKALIKNIEKAPN